MFEPAFCNPAASWEKGQVEETSSPHRPLLCAVRVTADVTALPGATEGYVVQAAEAVEENALRIAGTL